MMRNFCGTEVDWSATGAMLGGIGTILGVIAVIAAAALGRNTFAIWRKQTIEERRTATALTAMSVAWKVRDAIRYARDSWSKPRYDKPDFEFIGDALANPVKDTALQKDKLFEGGNAVLGRLDEHMMLFAELADVRPKVRALFGAQAELHLASLQSVANLVRQAAAKHAGMAFHQYTLATNLSRANEQVQALRVVMWTDWAETQGERDLMQTRLDHAISALEAEFQPLFHP